MLKVNVGLHEVFQALSDPYRIRMLSLMLRAPNEMCLCELCESLDEPEYKLSRHLKILKQAGLITSLRDGKWIYHKPVNDHKYLKAIHEVLSAFPDDEKDCENDFKRFQRCRKQRGGARCRVSPRTDLSHQSARL